MIVEVSQFRLRPGVGEHASSVSMSRWSAAWTW